MGNSAFFHEIDREHAARTMIPVKPLARIRIMIGLMDVARFQMVRAVPNAIHRCLGVWDGT